ncbi:GtrA family protein [Porphyromonadaceae bacterium]
MFYKFLKFGLVGASGFVLDFAITYWLKEKVRLNKYFANSTGFVLAATSNYFLNRLWTFVSSNPDIQSEYTLFIIISIIGLGINNFIIYLLTSRLSANFYLAKVIAIIIVTGWNFTMNYLYNFK